MRTRLAPFALAPAVLLAASAGCSLIAPSDAELMGGARGDAGHAGDATTDGGGDGGVDSAIGPGDAAPGGDGGACGALASDCTGVGTCCTGLVCDPTSQLCIPCTAAGGSCFPTDNTCCSGSCVGHTCR